MHLDLSAMGPHPVIQPVCELDRHLGVGLSVKDQERREVRNFSVGRIRVAAATVEVHHCADRRHRTGYRDGQKCSARVPYQPNGPAGSGNKVSR